MVDTVDLCPHFGSPTAGADGFQHRVSLSVQLFLALTYLDFRCSPQSGRRLRSPKLGQPIPKAGGIHARLPHPSVGRSWGMFCLVPHRVPSIEPQVPTNCTEVTNSSFIGLSPFSWALFSTSSLLLPEINPQINYHHLNHCLSHFLCFWGNVSKIVSPFHILPYFLFFKKPFSLNIIF